MPEKSNVSPNSAPHSLQPSSLLTFAVRRDSVFPYLGSPTGGWTLGPSSSGQVTALLVQWSRGDSAAREALIPIVYDELRRVARNCLASQPRNQTMQSTALVHEAYLRLVGRTSVHWENRVHFFAVASQLMRRILVDHARKRAAAKRGSNPLMLALDEAISLPQKRALDLVALDDALNTLATLDERQSRIVELRFFGGLSIEDTSQLLDLSPATVKREWATARTWLFSQMAHQEQ